ncbi:MAG: hypothetical protein JW700_01865 [Candidatus Aenigmarchaeota archaeon]|nr:hypothetical protein [Candidatus Aenigmarchaeota archaeon]
MKNLQIDKDNCRIEEYEMSNGKKRRALVCYDVEGMEEEAMYIPAYPIDLIFYNKNIKYPKVGNPLYHAKIHEGTHQDLKRGKKIDLVLESLVPDPIARNFLEEYITRAITDTVYNRETKEKIDTTGDLVNLAM